MDSGDKKIHSESIFVDSGAYSLYNRHVRKHGQRMGRHGRELATLPGRSSKSDYSYYDLRAGSDFRAFCDDYAGFMKKMQGRGLLFANVDAINNPELTWQIQKFFEEEHGVRPVPVVHGRTPLKYVDRYIQYPLLGVGGLGHQETLKTYCSWADNLYIHLCPKENDYLPLIRTHGFAMTSWQLLCRYPWWSVDSATWVKLSAYGWLYVPRWTEEKGFRFDRPPMMVNFSFRSPRLSERQRHYNNALPTVRRACDKWLAKLGLVIGSVDSEGEVKEFGVSSHHRARSIANLTYLKDLEESRPKWPYPLDVKLVADLTVKFQRPGIL